MKKIIKAIRDYFTNHPEIIEVSIKFNELETAHHETLKRVKAFNVYRFHIVKDLEYNPQIHVFNKCNRVKNVTLNQSNTQYFDLSFDRDYDEINLVIYYNKVTNKVTINKNESNRR
jgi:hypothetical protein